MLYAILEVSEERGGNEMLYTYLKVQNLVREKLLNEKGIETIEWIALSAVILVLLMGALSLMTDFGQATAALIFGKISDWIGRW